MMETFVKDWKMWAGAKLLAGMGVGAIQSTLPVYSEWLREISYLDPTT